MLHVLLVCQHVLGVLLQRNSVHQCHDYHVVSRVESHLIRERNSRVETNLASQGRRSFSAAAPPSSKSVKGSHGGVLVASPQLVATPGVGCEC